MKVLGYIVIVGDLVCYAAFQFAWRAWAQPRPNGTFGELYGALSYFRRYVYPVAIAAFVIGLTLLAVGVATKKERA